MPNPFAGDVLTIFYLGPEVEKYDVKFSDSHDFTGFTTEMGLYIELGKSVPHAIIIDVDFFAGYERLIADISMRPDYRGIVFIGLSGEELKSGSFSTILKKTAKKLADLIIEAI